MKFDKIILEFLILTTKEKGRGSFII